MPVEIDEAELAGLRQLQGVFNTMMNKNPKARRLVLEAQKIVNPDVAIPEIDAQQEVMGEVQKLSQRMDEFMGKITEKETEAEKKARISQMEASWNAGRSSLLAEGYNEDGIKKIEELMEQEGIASHKAAAAYFEKLNPPTEPIMPVNNKFDFFAPKQGQGDDKLKLLMEGNEDAFLNSVVGDTLTELRAGRR